MEIKEEENRPVMVNSPLFGCVVEAAIFYSTVGREYFLVQMAQNMEVYL